MRLLPRLLIAGLLVAIPVTGRAERLPIRSFTVNDGLSSNHINKIIRDRRGFVWLATGDGLSRFDGYGFTNYSVEQGLPHRTVVSIIEARNGDFWLGTSGGLVRFRPSGRPTPKPVRLTDPAGAASMFAFIAPDSADPLTLEMTTVFEADDHSIWTGGRSGVFRLRESGATFTLSQVNLGFGTARREDSFVYDLAADATGSIWAAVASGLYRRWPDGSVAGYTVADGLPGGAPTDLLLDSKRRLWVATKDGGLFRISTTAGTEPPRVVERYGVAEGLISGWVAALCETSDGRFWAATNVALVEILMTEGHIRSRTYHQRHGLSAIGMTALGEDAGGNLWIGTEVIGAMRLARNGLVTYSVPDGLEFATDLFEDPQGSLHVRGLLSEDARGRSKPPDAGTDWKPSHIGQRRGERFVAAWPANLTIPWTGYQQTILAATNDEWWIGMGTGLAHFPATRRWDDLANAKPRRIYSTNDGMSLTPADGAAPAHSLVYSLFEDSRGSIWVASIGYSHHGLNRFDPASNQFVNLLDAPGLPPVKTVLARAFGEDKDGNVWVGFHTGLSRYRNSLFKFFPAGASIPTGGIIAIERDDRGRLWLGSFAGLILVSNTSADEPEFRHYTMKDGLSGNVVSSILDGRDGYLYLATGRGVDQFNPDTGVVRHFGAADGLPSGKVYRLYRDRSGTIWFSMINGLAKYTTTPSPPASRPPPRVFITDLAVNDIDQFISATGETGVNISDLPHDANHLEISYVAIGDDLGDTLRYQYRLEGGRGEWEPLTTLRRVSYASLSPGRYRFVVRGFTREGLESKEYASVSFRVLPPFWRTWWFGVLALCALVAAGVALHRARVARLLEVERMRTRISADLHDDVGANLTRIAILSEVAQQSASDPAGPGQAKLASITDIARQSISAMNDIVWALNPQWDTLQAMVNKMRYHAQEVLEGRDVVLTLDLAPPADAIRVNLDVRRDVYLIFKEALNNVARHARCRTVSVTFRSNDAGMFLEVVDDGVGFVANDLGDGVGLTSMRRRAARVGATLEVVSGAGQGTRVTLTAPLGGVAASS